jgi:type VI secretion system protein ImpJ
MPKYLKVLWSEGMFLGPQHFQQQDAYHEGLARSTARVASPFPWGVREVEINTDALALGKLQLDRLRLVFAEGEVVDAPENDELPAPRDLAGAVPLGASSVVYAALPLLDRYGPNCRFDAEDLPRQVRFRRGFSAVADVHTGAGETEIPVARKNLRVLLDGDARDEYVTCPIARLTRDAGGRFALDAAFVPPALELAASPRLMTITRRLADIVLAKTETLAGMRRERVNHRVEFGSADVAAFWLLHTCNGASPRLQHLLAHPQSAPEALYLLLAELTGQLLTFATSGTVRDLPRYDHADPGAALERLDAQARELLETVIPTRYVPIRLEQTKPSYYVGRIEDERLVAGADFYIAVHADVPGVQLVEAVPRTFKVGSPDDIEAVVNAALPGVRLAHATRLPSAIPVKLDNHYFAIEPQGAVYERMMQARAVGFYVPKGFKDLRLELMAVLR